MTEGPRGEVVCPACCRPWERCVCEEVLGEDDWAQEEARCPDCSKVWERCECDNLADATPPSSHFLPAPELDL